MAVYAIVTAKNGPKMKATEGEGGGMRISTGAKGRQLKGSTTMGQLADRLSNLLDRPVLDMTGLKGNFEIDLSWSSEGEGVEGRGPMLPPDLAKEAKRLDDAADGADIFTALQEKLGLRLDARKAPVELLIIDNVEKIPTEN